jgi:Arc/MetJ-type ribon-helix-helix transcriptional regulator
MKVDILQDFLNRKLFNIGEADDTRFAKLRKAADTLAASLQSKRQAALNYSMVAFDPDVPPDEPIFEEVGSFVQDQWQTYKTCFSDVPRTLFRALLLEALWQSIQKDPNIATAVCLGARNVIPQHDLGNEKDIWSQIVTKASDVAEARARADWSAEVKIPAIQIKLPKLSIGAGGPTVAREALVQGLQGAAAPNPYGPGQNPAAWAQEFAKRATVAIADAIDQASQDSISQADLKKSFLDPLANFMNECISEMTKAIRAVALSSAGMQRRSQLLWWKEAAYSAIVQRSYRHFRPEEAVLLMVFDLVEQVPSFCPESVESFLHESVASGSFHSASEFVAIKDILSALVEKQLSSQLGDRLAKRTSTGIGRKPMIEFLANAHAAKKLDLARLPIEVGISAELRMRLADFAVWIFREIQALRVLGDVSSEAKA